MMCMTKQQAETVPVQTEHKRVTLSCVKTGMVSLDLISIRLQYAALWYRMVGYVSTEVTYRHTAITFMVNSAMVPTLKSQLRRYKTTLKKEAGCSCKILVLTYQDKRLHKP